MSIINEELLYYIQPLLYNNYTKMQQGSRLRLKTIYLTKYELLKFCKLQFQQSKYYSFVTITFSDFFPTSYKFINAILLKILSNYIQKFTNFCFSFLVILKVQKTFLLKKCRNTICKFFIR